MGRTGKVVVVTIALVGIGLLAWASYRALQHHWLRDRVARTYVSGDCTVISKTVHISMHTSRAHGRDLHRDTHAVYGPIVKYRYRVGTRWLESDRFSSDPPIEHDRTRIDELLRRYEVGKSYRCWYDPERPGQAVLEKP